jgi:aminopeptidase-like protein
VTVSGRSRVPTASGESGGERGSAPEGVGLRMHQLMEELFPIARSLTGEGVRETLRRLDPVLPLEVTEVPSGTAVFDWTVPKEWNIRGGHIRNSKGETVVDFRDSTLHVVGYSVPVHRTVGLETLRRHVHTLPDHPDWIPYRTSYYEESWGFCMPHRLLESLPDDDYEVRIDSTLADGSLTYGEHFLPGESPDEVLISAHCCHPSLCNDNLSGIVVAAFLARALARTPRRLSYRFLFAPATIGAITWLARNEARVERIRHGLVLACIGDGGGFHYKRSRRGSAEIDRAAEYVLSRSGDPVETEDFSPYGYDERQYCSPGFDLPVGRLSRTPHGRFPEYHTSADDLDFVTPENLERSLARCLDVVEVLERNGRFRNTNPRCEPQLGRRGLIGSLGGTVDKGQAYMAMLWVLNLSDGEHDLLSIAERSGLAFDTIWAAARALRESGLLAPVESGP